MLDDTGRSGAAAGGDSGGGIRGSSSGESLGAKVGRIKRALSDSACGPLVIAGDVVALVERWEEVKAEAGDMLPGAWLEKTFGDGKDVGWFTRRHEAAQRLDFNKDRSPQRTWHHEAAVWAAQNIKSEDDLRKLSMEVMAERKKNGSNPLTKTQVVALAKGLFGTGLKRRAKCCARCQRLEDALRGAGLPVPE